MDALVCTVKTEPMVYVLLIWFTRAGELGYIQ